MLLSTRDALNADIEGQALISNITDQPTTICYSNYNSAEENTFYHLLLQQASAWDFLPFIETVGANLCQNFYFLLLHSQKLCTANSTGCQENIGIILCCLDFFASGTQNTYQRFWKSLTWVWLERLSSPTKQFIIVLKEHLEKNKKTSALVVYLSRKDYAEIQHQDDNENQSYNWPNLRKKFVKHCTLQDSLELLAAHFKVDIILTTTQTDEITHSLSDEAVSLISPRANNLANSILHFNYSRDFTIKNQILPVQTRTLTLRELLHNPCHGELLTATYHLPNKVLSLVFLEAIPYLMLIFQTIGMLSKIIPNSDKNLALANTVLFFGACFGWGKGSVNNALRRAMAEENLKKFGQFKLYRDSSIYLGTALLNIIYALLFLVPIPGLWNPRQFAFYLIPALFRLLGIIAGISISLFYLYVGLFTKDGFEFASKTLMRDFGTNSDAFISFYEKKLRFYIDFGCVISSLSYNGLLTQFIESCNKLDVFAKKIENWIEPPKETDALTLVSPSKEKTPWWVHVANIGDILVFTMSAEASINTLIEKNLANSFIPGLSLLRGFLIFMHYALIGGITAGLANFIFTYAAAAPGQMEAWGKLSNSAKSSTAYKHINSWCSFNRASWSDEGSSCGFEGQDSTRTPLLTPSTSGGSSV